MGASFVSFFSVTRSIFVPFSFETVSSFAAASLASGSFAAGSFAAASLAAASLAAATLSATTLAAASLAAFSFASAANFFFLPSRIFLRRCSRAPLRSAASLRAASSFSSCFRCFSVRTSSALVMTSAALPSFQPKRFWNFSTRPAASM